MAEMNGNGHDSRQVDLLLQVVGRLDTLTERLDTLTATVKTGFDTLTGRMDRFERLLYGVVSERVQQHEERLRAIEERLGITR